MKNRNVGYLISGIAVVIGIIVWIFNIGLRNVVDQTCIHGSSCTMYDTIAVQTYLSLTIAGVVLVIGLFLIFSKESEKIVIKKVVKKVRKKRLNLSGLGEDERMVLKILQRENGAFFQKSVMEELECGKVKMTRLADRLEAKGFIERKRRGMNNILVLVQ